MWLLLELMLVLSHGGVTCLWLMLELQRRPTAFLTGSWGKTDNNSVSYLRWHILPVDLWPVSPNFTISEEHWVILCIYCEISPQVFKETSNCLDQHLCNKQTFTVVVYAHSNKVVFFSFSSVSQTPKQHCCSMDHHNWSKKQSWSTLTDAPSRPLPISFISRCWRSRVIDHYDWLHY